MAELNDLSVDEYWKLEILARDKFGVEPRGLPRYTIGRPIGALPTREDVLGSTRKTDRLERRRERGRLRAT